MPTKFITNEENNTLENRFNVLLQQSSYFDVLVGYFYVSGFYAIHESLQNVEHIRILVGIKAGRDAYDLFQVVQNNLDIKEELRQRIVEEFNFCKENPQIESGIRVFLERLENNTLEIKVYPHDKIHSKVYIFTDPEETADRGRIITGSSNLSYSGLNHNLEFNVELRNDDDYQFAKDKFDELWAQSIDLTEEYTETIKKDTWFRNDISPYEMYLKFLYEYFKDEINQDSEPEDNYRPDGFMELQYQKDAVSNAKRILLEYGGVFLSDVVGLGKTFMGTMLCQELDEKVLVIAPPALIDENNPGSWENAFRDFGFRSKDYRCESLGRLEHIIANKYHHRADIVLVDESHRFRNEDTQRYALLAQICRGKKVILVTATPYNNTPFDLLNQIKLFQYGRKSTIPNIPDLETYFGVLQRRIPKDRNDDDYVRIIEENATNIRENILKYLMVRRTRNEIAQYYAEDLANQGRSFAEIAPPQALFYELDEDENTVFGATLQACRDLTYARYAPLLYLNDGNQHQQGQKNMITFIKILLVKRLESSFHAFKKTLDRLVLSYETFIHAFENGNVYISPRHMARIFDFIIAGDYDEIERLIENEQAETRDNTLFNDQLLPDLQADLAILRNLQQQWNNLTNDPKFKRFKEALENDPILRENKLIIFTESKETAEYLFESLNQIRPNRVLSFTGSDNKATRRIVIQNFDAKSEQRQDDYDILITTDVLAEGVNLHRSCVIINYDLPWNPTKVMQRVGRINRVDTDFDLLYTYNFFPTEEGNEEIDLHNIATSKVAAFISLLGNDAQLLTDDEDVTAHQLFDSLMSAEFIEGEGNIVSELKYIQEIRHIKDTDTDLYNKIQRLPVKARTVRNVKENERRQLFTYFRKGKLEKFFVAFEDQNLSKELTFFEAVNLLKVPPDEQRGQWDEVFYNLMEGNLQLIENTLNMANQTLTDINGSLRSEIISKLKILIEIDYPGYTHENIEFLDKVRTLCSIGAFPKILLKEIKKEFKLIEEQNILHKPKEKLTVLQTIIPEEFITIPTYSEKSYQADEPNEIILSEFINESIEQ